MHLFADLDILCHEFIFFFEKRCNSSVLILDALPTNIPIILKELLDIIDDFYRILGISRDELREVYTVEFVFAVDPLLKIIHSDTT